MKIQDNTLVKVTNKDIIDGEFIVPDGVVSIGDWAFKDCTSLQQIILPAPLRSIGNRAFQGCTSLNDVQGSNRELVNQVRLQALIGKKFPETYLNKIMDLATKNQ